LSLPFVRAVLASFGDTWDFVPRHTIASACQSFRMLARSGALGYQLLMKRHLGFPYRMFQLLDTPEAAEDIIEERPCLKDPWTIAFIDSMGNTAEQLRSPEALCRLVAVASLQHVDTVSTERSHARNRRRTLGRLHTHIMSFEELAAWQTINSAAPESKPMPSSRPRKAADPDPGRAPPAKRRRSMGPWRVAISQAATPWISGKQNNFSSNMPALSEAYHAMSPEERARLKELGGLKDLMKSVGSVTTTARHRQKQKQFRTQKNELTTQRKELMQINDQLANPDAASVQHLALKDSVAMQLSTLSSTLKAEHLVAKERLPVWGNN
jgi:hypothetical protein